MNPETGVMNDRLKIVLVGAENRECRPASIRDLLPGDPLFNHSPSIMKWRTSS